MSIKVFLVEDEIVIREGIRKNINWEEEGFALVGDASDGELAYPLIRRTQPDILVTDIRMPFMDGLELSRLVKKEFPNIKIIILSGFNEFDYAKEAIDIGVTEYLLKPITGPKLLEVLHKVGDMVTAEKRQMEAMDAITRRMEEQQMQQNQLEQNAGQIEDDPVMIDQINMDSPEQESLAEFLATGSIDRISRFIRTYVDNLGRDNLKSTMFRQYVVGDIYFTCVNFLKELEVPTDEITEVCGQMQDLVKGANTQTLADLLERIMQKRDQLRMDSSSMSTVLEAKDYINKHYRKDEISLNDVAACVNLSPNHFSTVFKKETGGTFIEYLTEVRMQQARKLLRTTSTKVTEISELVGYKDPHYFSFLFKKIHGMTPKEYRMNERDAEIN